MHKNIHDDFVFDYKKYLLKHFCKTLTIVKIKLVSSNYIIH